MKSISLSNVGSLTLHGERNPGSLRGSIKLPIIHKNSVPRRHSNSQKNSSSITSRFTGSKRQRFRHSINSIIGRCTEFEDSRMGTPTVSLTGKFLKLSQEVDLICSPDSKVEEHRRRQLSIRKSNRRTSQLLMSDAQVLKAELNAIVVKGKKIWTRHSKRIKG